MTTPPDLAALGPFLELAAGRLRKPVDAARLDELAAVFAAADVQALEPALHARLAGAPAGAGWVGVDLVAAPHGRVSLFLLPPGEGIPLHDHPGMTVLQRVALGSVWVVEHDWLDPPPAAVAGPARARRVGPEDGVLWAYPDRGNVHALVPLEPTAFIDVLTPDYGPARPCTYWRVAAPTPDGVTVQLVAADPPPSNAP